MLNQYFKRSEVACSCGCGFDSIDQETLAALTAIREHFDSPLKITSACRCVVHNANCGGVPSSQHTRARAADIVVEGQDPSTVADYAESLGISVGRYNTFTHIDTRSGLAARWNG